MSERVISWSELKTFATCKRQWYLRYYKRLSLKVQPPKTPAHAGTLIHDGLHHYYLPDKKPDPFPVALAEAEQPEYAENRKEILKMIRMCRDVVENYKNWVDDEEVDKYFQPQTSELHVKLENAFKLFDFPWPKNWGIQGYIDMVGYNPQTGTPIMFETKTTSYKHATWMNDKLFPLRWQVKLYVSILQYLNPELKYDVVFNVLRRVRGTSNAARPLFWRHPIKFGAIELNHALGTFALRAAEMESIVGCLDEQGDSPVEFYNDQIVWPNPLFCNYCDYRPVCQSFDDGTNIKPLIEEFYSRRDNNV